MSTIKSLVVLSVFGLLSSLLSGCASIVSGTTQSISVETPSVTGAQCSLINDKGEWYINSTPGSVMVHRSYQDLVIACQKAGYLTDTKRVKSTTKAMVFGNVLFGGGIGAGVDVADGAAYNYPTDIQVPMARGHARG